MGALAFIRRQTIRKPLFGRGVYTQTPGKQTLEDLSGYCRVLSVVDGGLTQTQVESFRWGSLYYYFFLTIITASVPENKKDILEFSRCIGI